MHWQYASCCRCLALHNCSISVTDRIDQLNMPAVLKVFVCSALHTLHNTCPAVRHCHAAGGWMHDSSLTMIDLIEQINRPMVLLVSVYRGVHALHNTCPAMSRFMLQVVGIAQL